MNKIDLLPTIDQGYLVHIAIKSYNLSESKDFYSNCIGATVFRELDDRITFGILNIQLVTHLTYDKDLSKSPSFYPNHFGLTFLSQDRIEAMYEKSLAYNIKSIYSKIDYRFKGRQDEHMTFSLIDPSKNFVEFKYYTKLKFPF